MRFERMRPSVDRPDDLWRSHDPRLGMEKVVIRIAMILFDRSHALIAGNIDLARQPEHCVKAVDRHGAKLKLGGQLSQMQIRQRCKQVRSDLNDVVTRLVDPENALEVEGRCLSTHLKGGRLSHLAGILRKRHYISLAPALLLLAQV